MLHMCIMQFSSYQVYGNSSCDDTVRSNYAGSTYNQQHCGVSISTVMYEHPYVYAHTHVHLLVHTYMHSDDFI